jgi:hypothetical protein
MAITTAQAEKLLRAEGRLARARLREEVRNSVKDVMLRDGMGRDEIRKAIQDVLVGEVRKRAGEIKARDILREMVREEITRLVGINFVGDNIKKLLIEEIGKQAKSYVDNSVIIKTNTTEVW